MNVGIVFYSEYPQNRGVLQLAKSLKDIGLTPYVVARESSIKHQASICDGIPVIKLSQGGKNSLLSTPMPLNLLWHYRLVQLASRLDWKAVIVRETTLSLPVILAAKAVDIPAFLDMRENLAASHEAGPERSFFSKLIRSRPIVQTYEALTINKFRHILTVSKELRDWAIDRYGINKEKVSVLGNYPTSNYVKEGRRCISKRTSIQKKEEKKPLRLVHAGWVMKNRGIQDIIRAIGMVVEKGLTSITIDIIGDDRHNGCVKELKRLSSSMNIRDHVTFNDYPDYTDLPRILATYDVGVSSNILTQLTHLTIPGKLWEYMAVGLAVLSSNRRTVRRIVRENRCGRIYNSRNTAEIASHLAYFIRNRNEVKKMGDNAFEAVMKKYNHAKIVQRVSDVMAKNGLISKN